MINTIITASLMVISFLLGYHLDPIALPKKETGVYIVYRGLDGVGTAFKVSNNKMVTAAHVCEALDDLDEVLIENDEDATSIETMYIHPNTAYDVCVIKTNGPVAGYEFELSSEKVSRHSRITSYGYPKAERPILILDVIVTSTEVIHSPFYFGDLTLPTNLLIETTKEIIPGMSGGPALNQDGEVVGINARVNFGKKRSYFTPVYRIKEFVDGL